MNWMQFVSSLVSSLAWPAVTIFTLLSFKGQIARLIPFLQKLTVGAFQAEFAKELSEVAAAVEQPQASDRPAADTGIGGDPLVTERAEVIEEVERTESTSDDRAVKINPTGFVMESWKEFEATLREIAGRTLPLMNRASRDMKTVLEVLKNANIINPDEFKSIMELRRLRNAAAHAIEPITAESAAQFSELSTTLTWRFRERAAKLGLWS